MNDLRPSSDRTPTKGEVYKSKIEKTNVILPVDDQVISLNPGVLLNGSKSRLKKFFSLLGPGIITGASDDDPSGIATYSVSGVQFGYRLLWLAPATFFLSAAVQEVCARIGIVTGHGLASVIKKHYSKWVLYFIVSLLVIANTINIGADLQAMAASIRLLYPALDFAVVAVSLTALILFFLVTLSYKAYARYLKIACVSLFSYVAVAFMIGVPWGDVLHQTFFPAFSLEPAYLLSIVAILGTTISPYMFFWQANEEVEEEISKGVIRKDDPETEHKNLLHVSRDIIKDMYIDVNVGMFYSELIMFFIIIATAGTLHAQGISGDPSTLQLDQIASVLKPLVGDTAFWLFTLGVVGVGLLAVPVLAGSASYAISELFNWQQGLNKKFHEAKGFYLVIITSTLVGLCMNFIGIQPVAALYYTAIINAVVAVPLLGMIWHIGNNRAVVGEHTSGILSNILVPLTFLCMGGTLVILAFFA